jgi:hypothetical protein
VTPFDPIKAQREILTGLAEVHKVVAARERDAERRLAEAEADRSAFAKIEFDLMQAARTNLHKLEAEAEAQEKMGSPP